MCGRPASTAQCRAWRGSGAWADSTTDDLVQVPVGGGAGDAVIVGQRVRAGAVAEPAQSRDRLQEAGQRPAAAACRGGAAASSLAGNNTVSLGTSSVAR